MSIEEAWAGLLAAVNASSVLAEPSEEILPAARDLALAVLEESLTAYGHAWFLHAKLRACIEALGNVHEETVEVFE